MHTYFKGMFWSIRLVAVVLCFAFFVLITPTASADPHALFYTTTGQQQLFFNVLAALNQSDFVEPAQQSPATPPGYSRQELLDKRSEEGFGAETDPRITQTNTQLASVLTRSITLEGNDLWTAYLLHQFAIERTRARNTDELVRIYCERGLGLENCEHEVEDPAKLTRDQKAAFVQDPAQYDSVPTVRGAFSVLLSGKEEQQEAAKKALQEDPNSTTPPLPLEYDASISRWWKKADGDEAKKEAAENTVADIINKYITPTVDETFWDKISFTNEGEVVPEIENESNELVAHENLFRTMLGNKLALQTIADSAEQKIKTQTLDTTVDGAVPDIELTSTGEKAEGDSYRELSATVKLPSHAKVSAVGSAIDTVSNTEQNRKYAATESEHTPGSTQSVDRAGTGNVAGIQSTDSQTSESTGRVLHATSTTKAASDDPTRHAPQQPGSPNDNDTAFHHEISPSHLIEALGYNPASGCGCSLHAATNHYGQLVLQKINGFRR